MTEANLLVILPSTAKVDDSVKVSLQWVDRFGRLLRNASGLVQLRCRRAGEEQPFILTSPMTILGQGCMAISFERAGVYRVEALDAAGHYRAFSNPILVGAENRLLWGDIHGHGGLSDGIGSPKEYYSFGRDVANLDICALTEHVEYPGPMSEEAWKQIQLAAEEFYAPGSFVTFLGFEWTAGGGLQVALGPPYGHRCVYYLRNAGQPFFRADDPRTNTPDKLWKALSEYECLIVPHHTAVNNGIHSFDWDYHNPKLEPLVEIYSSWGCSEGSVETGNHRPILRLSDTGDPLGEGSDRFVLSALKRGYRLGLVAGSDGHDGRPGRSAMHAVNPEPFVTPAEAHLGPFYPSGLVAVYAESATREGVWEALKARRVYGTTGSRIVVTFNLNGKPMGSDVRLDLAVQSRNLSVAVHGTDILQRMEIIRDGAEFATWLPDTLDFSASATDDSPLVGTSFYYLRVTQLDGEMAWSSPIWVTSGHAAG